jgi:capsular polysaccharide transport system permease protein
MVRLAELRGAAPAMTDMRIERGRLTVIEAIVQYAHVMAALILRDIKGRYFGSAWGYLISLGWPLTHIAILMLINGFLGAMQPYGESTLLWYATGIVPFMAFNYTARFITLGFLQNYPLMNFPIVRPLDILFARVIVEVLSVGIVFFIIFVTLAAFSVDFMPVNLTRAYAAMAICVFDGIGYGIIIALLSRTSQAWGVIGFLLLILLWAISGIFFVPSSLPDMAKEILAYNPIMHVIAYYRSAYYDGYASDWLDVEYAVTFGVIMLFVGLVIERLLRVRLRQ